MGLSKHWRAQHTLWAKFRLWIEQQRYQIRAFIQQRSLQHKGLLLALLTGDKSLLSSEIEDQFQRFGISHLLAISGPHVLIFAAMLCWGLDRLIRGYRPHYYLWMPRQYLLLLPFLSCVGLYTAFVGFEIPALRTLLMCSVVTIMLLLKQKISSFALLIYSAALLLYLDPLSVLSAAFWLSYGACFILGWLYADSQLQQRMQWREVQRDTAEVIVYVRQLNQLKDNSVSQPVEVLNRHPQTVTWLATLAQNSVLPHLELGRY